MDGVNYHKLTPRLSALKRRDVNLLFRARFSLIVQKFPQICVGQTQSIQHGNLGELEISLDRLKSLRLNPKLSLGGYFLAGDEAATASPRGLAS